MTIVGDIAQSTGPWARDTWDDVLQHLPHSPVAKKELEFGYRVPRQVFDLAARLLPRIAPELALPTVVREGPEQPDYKQVSADDRADSVVEAAMHHAGFGRSVGVIATAEHGKAIAETFRDRSVEYVDASRGELGRSINLLSPSDAKGLEFDAVVVVEPEAIVDDEDAGERALYVAMTRTTKYLTVVHVGAPLPKANAAPVVGEADSHSGTDRDADTPARDQERSSDINDRRGPDRLLRVVAREIANQVSEGVVEDSWDALIEALTDELASRRRQGDDPSG